jgi:hypothetical protein
MELGDLNDAWRRLGEKERGDDTAVLERVRARGTRLNVRIHLRDRMETAVGFLLAPLFAWLAFATPHLLSRVGAVILAVSCVHIPLRFRAARRPPPALDATFVETLQVEWARVNLQRTMLRQIAVWYAGPLWVGVTLFLVGPLSLLSGLIVSIGTAAVFGLVVYANRAVVRIELDPIARELREELDALEPGPPSRS